MLYVIGQISTGLPVLQQTASEPIPNYLARNAAHLGIDVSDLGLYTTTDGYETRRVMNRDAFNLVWDGTAITGIDFAPQDTKNRVYVTVNKPRMIADGADDAVFTVELTDADSNPLAFSGTRAVPVTIGNRSIYIALTFTNGTATYTLTTADFFECGHWCIPQRTREFDNIIVASYAELKVMRPGA